MTRDVQADIGGSDILFTDGLSVGVVFFDVVWGKILQGDDDGRFFANIVIPVRHVNILKYSSLTDDLIIRIKAPYAPASSHFYFRFVTTDGYDYNRISEESVEIPVEVQAYTYAFSSNLPQKLTASQMAAINQNGEYLIRIERVNNNNFNRAYVYSANESDLLIGQSDDQASKLLALCAAGKYYRYPVSGVGATDYINSVVQHTDLSQKLSEQFENNGMPIMNAEFDVTTGNLETVFSSEQMPEPDEGLTEISQLDLSVVRVAADDFIRRTQAMSGIDYNESMFGLMMKYGFLYGLYFFPDNATEWVRLADSTEQGTLDCDGNIVGSEDGQLVVTANIRKGTVIIFDLPNDNGYDTHPAYAIYNSDGTEVLDTCLVGQDFGDSDDFKTCGLVMSDVVLKYNLRQADFNAKRGVYLLEDTEENFKNLLAMVVDEVTGRLLGITTSTSNIDDAVLDVKSNNLLVKKL